VVNVLAVYIEQAVRRLAKSDGNVRLAIEDNVLEL
jgi:hypothetical protein